MARIRSIKPEFWTNSTTGRLTGAATKLYLGLHNHADDYGVIRYDEDELRVRILPYERASNIIEKAVRELEQAGAADNPSGFGLVVRFTVDHKEYIWLTYFTRHQKVDHPGAPLLADWNATTTPLSYADSATAAPTRADSSNPREPSRTFDLERRGEERINPFVEQGSTGRTEIETVWTAYSAHHPRAQLTTHRRDLIRRRLKDHPAATLAAAIHGNHKDPHCNGQNDRGTEFHALTLILRDADHIERYAALHTEAQDAARITLTEALELAARNGH